MSRLIQAGEITNYIYNESRFYRTRFESFEQTEKRKHLIYKAIYDNEDFKYFDKYGNEFRIDEIEMYRNTIDEIMNVAEIIYEESRKQIENYDLWVIHITPLFKEKFNREYRTEYVGFYNKESQDFIKVEKNKFLEKL